VNSATRVFDSVSPSGRASSILELAANHNLHRSFMLPLVARAHAINGNTEEALRMLRKGCESEWKSSLNAGSE
jgi:hypothetical protein